MPNDEFNDLVAREEAKRKAKLHPQREWEMMQQMPTGAESQATGQRNTKDACLREQKRLLALLEAHPARTDNGEPRMEHGCSQRGIAETTREKGEPQRSRGDAEQADGG